MKIENINQVRMEGKSDVVKNHPRVLHRMVVNIRGKCDELLGGGERFCQNSNQKIIFHLYFVKIEIERSEVGGICETYILSATCIVILFG